MQNSPCVGSNSRMANKRKGGSRPSSTSGVRDKQRKELKETLAGAQTGDILDPATTQTAQKLGINVGNYGQAPKPVAQVGGVPIDPSMQAESGSLVKRPSLQEQQVNERKATVAAMPDGPLKQAAVFRLATGSTEPAGIIKAENPATAKPTKPLVYVDPDTMKVYDAAGKPLDASKLDMNECASGRAPPGTKGPCE